MRLKGSARDTEQGGESERQRVMERGADRETEIRVVRFKPGL